MGALKQPKRLVADEIEVFSQPVPEADIIVTYLVHASSALFSRYDINVKGNHMKVNRLSIFSSRITGAQIRTSRTCNIPRIRTRQMSVNG